MNSLTISVLVLSILSVKSFYIDSDPELLQRVEAEIKNDAVESDLFSEKISSTPASTTEKTSFLDLLQQIEDLPIFQKHKKINSEELEAASKEDIEISIPVIGAQLSKVMQEISEIEKSLENESLSVEIVQDDLLSEATEIDEKVPKFFSSTMSSTSVKETSTKDQSNNLLEVREVVSPNHTQILYETINKEISSETPETTTKTNLFGKLREDIKMKVLLLKNRNRSRLDKSQLQLTTAPSTTTEKNYEIELNNQKVPLEKLKSVNNIKMYVNTHPNSNDKSDCSSKCSKSNSISPTIKETLQTKDSISNNAVEEPVDSVESAFRLKMMKSKSAKRAAESPTPAPFRPMTNVFQNIKRQAYMDESSVERAEKFNENIHRLMQFVSIMAQIDSFVTSRARSTIRKLNHLYGGDDMPLSHNLRSKNPDSFT